MLPAQLPLQHGARSAGVSQRYHYVKCRSRLGSRHFGRPACTADFKRMVAGPVSRLSSSIRQHLESMQLAFLHRSGTKRADSLPCTATGGGGGSGVKLPPLGGSGGAGEGSGEGDDADELLSKQQAEELAAAKGVELPADFLQAAAGEGLRKSALQAYLALQGSIFAGWLARLFPAFRDRLIADPRFFFKVFSEVAIDSGCATVAEVRKRGDDFWNEFDFYLSDLIVGCVLDVVLVTLLAPVAVIGARSTAAKATGMQKIFARIPSAVFAPSPAGAPRYTVLDRSACLGVKFLEYSLAGLVCGFVGQGIANGLMRVKRKVHGVAEGAVDIPPLGMTALTWGLFMGTSSNVRYQIVYGIEHLVEVTVAKKIPAAAYATTLIVRFINNIVGGENFIDMARWTGIQ
ncbi:g7082 [Coccomyxa elongata]